MIYVIEIPHQHPPIAWAAKDRSNFNYLVFEESSETGNPLDEFLEGSETEFKEESEFFEECLEWLGSDLNNLHVFENEQEAKAALEDDSLWNNSQHQGSTARNKLKKLLEYHA